ncbi:ParB/RepB/Spo0J family partition protein (plasmid) [Saccharothrix sp. AJ9571]|nr:ParB/RepB/Spo0J family partition protein [Saccharothrix sp. AJ9571]
MGKRVDLASLADDDFYDPADDAPAGTAVAAVADEPPASGAGQPVDRLVPTSTVTHNPLNKRYPGLDDEIEDLAETLRFTGIIQPLVVCSAAAYLEQYPDQRAAVGRAEWVALIGNRRLHAALRAPLDEVPIIVADERVGSMYELMLIENGHRRGLPPLLEAEAMAEVLRTKKISQRELARQLGKSHTYIAQRLVLLKLVPDLQAAFAAGELKIEQAREFGDLPADEQQRIADAGKPYRHQPPPEARRSAGNGVATRRRASIRATSPAVAAESIRQHFTPDELTELIQLLTNALGREAEPRQPAQSAN